MIINTTLRGKKYAFETKAGLFSSHRVDDGSRLLIENVSLHNNDTALDLGCGYGPIGIVAANLVKNGKVYMVDVDVRAIKYSLLNSSLNKTKNVDIRLSDGFESLPDIRFDAILSHLPTHVSKEILVNLIEESNSHLNSGGKIYLVFEKRISPFIKREIEKVFGNYRVVKTSSNHLLCSAVYSSNTANL